MTSILVLPDSHSKPGVTNRRYEWVGRLIADRKPDIVVSLGDFYDMPSLSSYDKGKKSFEGRRYKRDIESGNEALEQLDIGLGNYNCRKVFLIGNHEERIIRAIESQPELDGVIGYKDFAAEGFGWEFHQIYMKPVIIHNIAFAHTFATGVKNVPISSEYPAAAILKAKFHSCVQGHTHIRDYAERTAVDGRRIMALVAGCWIEDSQWETYAGEANRLWWRGITILNDVNKGSFNPEFIPIERIRREYSN